MFIYTLGILEQNLKILLMLRQNTTFFNNCWSLVGGKLESGENVTEALIREAYEELGITITKNNLYFVHCLSWKNGHQDCLLLVFKINKWIGAIMNSEPRKCAEINWFPINNLPKNIIPLHKDVIEKVTASIPYYEYENDWNIAINPTMSTFDTPKL